MGLVVGCGSKAKDETYSVTINNTGEKYDTKAAFLQQYATATSSVATNLSSCSNDVSDIAKLNECKKDVADEIQKIVDIQGPSDVADKEKKIDELMVQYNDIVQSITSTFKSSDMSGLQSKLSTWMSDFTTAVKDYQAN
jgi:proline dehydrogenase